MTTWFRTYDEDEDPRLYFEVGADDWAMRQVELRSSDLGAVIAASLEEVQHLRDHADLAAMQRYEQQLGVLAEGSLDGWREQPRGEEIAQGEFERVWCEARALLAGSRHLQSQSHKHERSSCHGTGPVIRTFTVRYRPQHRPETRRR